MNEGSAEYMKVDTAVWMSGMCLFIGLIIGTVGGYSMGQRYCKADAIKANVAEWRVDPKTGNTTFTWLGNTQP